MPQTAFKDHSHIPPACSAPLLMPHVSRDWLAMAAEGGRLHGAFPVTNRAQKIAPQRHRNSVGNPPRDKQKKPTTSLPGSLPQAAQVTLTLCLMPKFAGRLARKLDGPGDKSQQGCSWELPLCSPCNCLFADEFRLRCFCLLALAFTRPGSAQAGGGWPHRQHFRFLVTAAGF